MSEPAPFFPECLLRGLRIVDDEVERARYNAALGEIGVDATEQHRFHVDAAGWSPEIAAERRNAHYLSKNALQPHAIFLGLPQLAADWIHPELGYAEGAFRELLEAQRPAVAGLSLREPLVGEVLHSALHVETPAELADLGEFEVHLRTPGGLVRGRRRLEEMKSEFRQSERRWLDDAFISEMAELAEHVRDLEPVPAEGLGSRHRLGPFHLPAFGGSYVFEERGALSRSALTHVLCAEAAGEDAGSARRSARGRAVDLRPLDPASALELLERHGMARLDANALRREPESIEKVQAWIAARSALDAGADPGSLPLETRALAGFRFEGSELPAAWRELEELRRQLGARTLEAVPELSAPVRLRLLEPASTRAPIRRFVRHLQAGLDDTDLASRWRDAPDLFFEQWLGLSEARRHHFARWLAASAP